jgi:hypothetical protein
MSRNIENIERELKTRAYIMRTDRGRKQIGRIRP